MLVRFGPGRVRLDTRFCSVRGLGINAVRYGFQFGVQFCSEFSSGFGSVRRSVRSLLWFSFSLIRGSVHFMVRFFSSRLGVPFDV